MSNVFISTYLNDRCFFIEVIYMKIIAWIVLILNAIVGLLNFTKVFTKKSSRKPTTSVVGMKAY